MILWFFTPLTTSFSLYQATDNVSVGLITEQESVAELPDWTASPSVLKMFGETHSIYYIDAAKFYMYGLYSVKQKLNFNTTLILCRLFTGL